jgi:hypothetical protein
MYTIVNKCKNDKIIKEKRIICSGHRNKGLQKNNNFIFYWEEG